MDPEDKADVSVVISTYNRLWSLPKAVDSCRKTNCRTEIIVVDDGSTDATWSWLEEQSDVIRLRQANQGQTWAINRGVASASGRYIRFLDSDDFLHPGIIDRQYRTALETGAELVYSRVDHYKHVDGVITETEELEPWSDFMAVQLGEPHASHFLGMLFKRELIEQVPRRPDFAYREDRMFLLEVSLLNPKIAHVPGCGGYWVQHGEQMQANYHGMKAVVANWQHLNIYRRILSELTRRDELTSRRKRAAVKSLWPLAHWTALTHPTEAAEIVEWIYRLDPDFQPPETGMLGKFYHHLGFRRTESLLRMRRNVKKYSPMRPNENLNLSRYEWIPSILGTLLPGSPSKLLLDIGAGDGRMKAPVEAAGGTYRGFDLFPASAQIDRWDLDEPAAAGLPPAGGAILLDVIEHCNNPGLALRHVAGALLPSAFLVLTMPNPKWSRARLMALESGNLACFTQSDLDRNHHVFTTWPHILERLLADAGFRVEHSVTLDGKTSWPAGPFTLRYPVRLSAAAVMKFIERRDPSACGMSYGIVARKQA